MPNPTTSGPAIRELTASEFPLILPLIEKHNAKIPAEELRRRLDEMIPIMQNPSDCKETA